MLNNRIFYALTLVAMYYMCSISKNKLNALTKWYRENGLTVRKKSSGGRKNNSRSLSIEDVRKVISFVTSYAEKNAISLPGRISTHARDDIMVLPSSSTKEDIYRLYERTTNESGKLLCYDTRYVIT